jgi:probable HAF family extracellular repeat protein
MTDLGVLPGDYGSESSGVNEKGQVVGGSQDMSGTERAFLWENGVMYDLNSLSPVRPYFFHSQLLLIHTGTSQAGAC